MCREMSSALNARWMVGLNVPQECPQLAHKLRSSASISHGSRDQGEPVVVSESPRVELPSPDTTTLANAPLELVVCQLRHERAVPGPHAAFALAIQSRLSDSYPNIGQAGIAEIVVDAAKREVTGGDQSGWHLKSDDGNWTVVLMPEFFALECVGYTRWSEFSRRMRDLVAAVAGERPPALMQRIGLRYVDRLSRPASRVPREWRGFIDDSLLGLGASDRVGPAVIVAQTVNQVRVDGVDAVLRSSCAPDNGVKSGYSTVLDTDAYDDRGRAFELGDVESTLDNLHQVSLQLFQLVVSEDFRSELHG